MPRSVDQKPPRRQGDERETLLALLRYQRESLVRKVDGLDDEAAHRRRVASGTTLLWLVGHMADAETTWLAERFAGRRPAPPVAPEALDDAVAAYRAAWRTSDDIVAAAHDLGQPSVWTDESGEAVDLRWVLAHLLEETARHAGHADILRELEDGATGR